MGAFPTNLTERQFPVADLSLSDAGNEAVDYLAYRGLELMVGFAPDNQPGILHLAVTTDGIQEYCTNDAEVRFLDLPAMQAWAEKGRGQFLLQTIKGKTVQGYSFSGENECEELPDHPITTAYRTIVPGTGAALAIATVEVSRELYDDEHGYGLETWASNRRAIRTYLKIGALLVDTRSVELNKAGEFDPVTRPTRETGDHVFMKNGRLVRVDTRNFMSLPERFQTGLLLAA